MNQINAKIGEDQLLYDVGKKVIQWKQSIWWERKLRKDTYKKIPRKKGREEKLGQINKDKQSREVRLIFKEEDDLEVHLQNL